MRYACLQRRYSPEADVTHTAYPIPMDEEPSYERITYYLFFETSQKGVPGASSEIHTIFILYELFLSSRYKQGAHQQRSLSFI